jgi:anti-anti-sigma regulatory factor
MSALSPGIFVACTPAAVFFRIVGEGEARNSSALKDCAQRKLQLGYQHFYIDLRACDGLDSTFLGVFAGLGLELTTGGKLTLLGLAGNSRRAFVELGFEQMAAVEAPLEPQDSLEFPPDEHFKYLPGSNPTVCDRPADVVDRALLMLEADECLCRLTERNEPKFREVKQFLRQDIARHTGGEPLGS